MGQTKDNQLNNLSELAKALGNRSYWRMKNGYVHAHVHGYIGA